jgi:hypothetical protein
VIENCGEKARGARRLAQLRRPEAGQREKAAKPLHIPSEKGERSQRHGFRLISIHSL